MNELWTVGFLLLSGAGTLMLLRAAVLVIQGYRLAALFAVITAAIPSVGAVYVWPTVNAIRTAGAVDMVLIGALVMMSLAFVFTMGGFVAVFRNGGKFTKPVGQILVAGPALFWSLGWFAFLRIAGLIYFEWFGTLKAVNSMLSVQLAIFGVLFISEYAGNVRNVQAKMAEVMTLIGGKRTGQSLTEGLNLVPGVLPLFLQVGLYALLRFSFFWASVREFLIPPITFAATFVAYTADRVAIVLELSGIYEPVDHYGLDDLKDDASPNPWAKVERLVESHASESVNRFLRSYSLWELVEGEGLASLMAQAMRRSDTFPEVKLKRLTGMTFLGLKDQTLQRIFQEWAGQDLRDMNQTMKLREIYRLVDRLRRIDPSATFEEAERIWESAHNGGRGSFKFKFG